MIDSVNIVNEAFNYRPCPANVDDIQLSAEILLLTEKLAKNTHEIWAKGRIEEGWKYGPTYDGENKYHPCLIPYELLPEKEKEYDRNTAVGAIKYLVSLGFTLKNE